MDGTNTTTHYVDGVAVDTDTYSNDVDADDPLWIGRIKHNYGYGMNALMDDVRLYNRALGPNEIACMYNQMRDGGYGELAAKPQRFWNIPFTAEEPPAPDPGRTPPAEVAIVEGPSGKSDVLFEMIPANLRGGRNRMTVNSGGINFANAGTKSQIFPASQAAVNKLDNRFVTSERIG